MMPSQPMFSLWTPLLKAWLCYGAHQSGCQLTGDVDCQVKDGTRMAKRSSVLPCTPWFKVEAAVLKNDQYLAFGTFLLPSITPIATIDNYEVQQKSPTGLRRVIRHHHAPSRAKLAKQAQFNIPAPVVLANDDAIVEIGRICKPLPEPIKTIAAQDCSGLSSFESALSFPKSNKTSPRSFSSCRNFSTEPECWPNARMVPSSAGPPPTLNNPYSPMESRQGTFMRSRQPRINDLAQIDPAIIANPAQRKSSLPRIPSPADRETFEVLLEVGVGNTEKSTTTQISKMTLMLEELPTSSSTAKQEEICPGSNAIGHPCSPSPTETSHETEDLNHTLTLAMTDGSYEPKTVHTPSLIQDENFLDALSGAETVTAGHSLEHMSLFQALIDSHGSKSSSETLDWLNIDHCHCFGLDTEIEELDLSRPSYRTPRAGIFRADLISCQLPTLEAGTKSREATIVDAGDSLHAASQDRVDPKAELARKTMAPAEEIKRAFPTRNNDLCKNASRSGLDTDEVEEDQADGKTLLVTSSVSDNEANEDPVDRLLDDARRAGGSSYTIRSALKDAIFCKNVRRSHSKVEKEVTHGTVPCDTVKAAKAGSHPLSQSMHGPTGMSQEDQRKGARPKQFTLTARRSQNTTCLSTSEDRIAKKEGISKSPSPKHLHSSIPGRAQGNRARFMWIPHDKFHAVEMQVSKSGSDVEGTKSEIDAEDPFTEEGAVYTSHTRCQLALAHAARILEARLG